MTGFDTKGYAGRVAGDLIHLARCRKIDKLSDALVDLVVRTGDDHGGLLRAVVDELVATSVRVLLTRCGHPGGGELFTVAICDAAGDGAPIDDLEPAVRAVLRAVLAALNGDQDDAAYQIDLALGAGSTQERLRALTHCLGWAIELLDAPPYAELPELRCLSDHDGDRLD
jgi:hypothetical protein